MGSGSTPEKQFAIDVVDQEAARLSAFHREIWSYHEPAWREYKSVEAYARILREEGFDVEMGSGGMPTAFCATWGDSGPVIGSYAEYDAVPGNSQEVVPERKPREGLHPGAAGHTDPHSMLGTATLGGVIAAKRALETHNIPGRIRFHGEPAEKVCGSKPVHAARGYYDGVDAYIAYHPWPLNSVHGETHFGAYWSAVFTFECTQPEAWNDLSTLPKGAGRYGNPRCPGAVDALCLMYTSTKYTKEAMFAHTGSWTINEYIMSGGDATSDNLPPKFAQIQYAWRSFDLNLQERIFEILANNARHAAEMTGCEASVRWVTKTRVGLPNLALSQLTYENLEAIGAPSWNDEAIAFGQALQENLGWEKTDFPFSPSLAKLTTLEENDAMYRSQLPPWQTLIGGDDYVEYCWHAPTVRLLTARADLAVPAGANHAAPGWARNALGGLSAAMDPGMLLASKVIAATIVELCQDPDALAACKAEWEERTGGGIGGDTWVGPLLEESFPPPIELPWPEYVTTARGDEWVLPAPLAGASEYL